jgi:diguanylate cyclase (GGDEF)-like protein
MSHFNVSVLIVDDANFSCEMTRRALKNAGYKDIRVSNSAQNALETMRTRQADVLLADWMMPDMDGIQLTEQVRFLDEEHNHYTYILLLTAKDGIQSLTHAFDQGVDDFLKKSQDSNELIARIHAASRVATLQNTLLETTERLTEMNHHLEKRNSFDPLTGLGNRFYLEKHLQNLMAHTSARGGSACCAVVRINQFSTLVSEYGQTAADEIIMATAKRLQQSVRPLDTVGVLAPSEFAVIMQHPDVSHCRALSFKRIFQAINLRTYKTSAGFISIAASISVCPIDSKTTQKHAGEIINHVLSEMDNAENYGRVYETSIAV